MNSIYDIQQLLKRFNIFIYVGDRLADLELMEEEVKELYSEKLITAEEFQVSMLLLKREINNLKKTRNE